MPKIANLKIIIETRNNTVNTKDKDPRIQKLNTILGPRGIRADELLRRFDAMTASYANNIPLPVYLKIQINLKGKSQSYEMKIGMISTSFIVKKILNLEKLSSKPKKDDPIYVAPEFIDQVFNEKIKNYEHEYNANNLKKSIHAQLLSFGIEVTN